MNGGAGQRVDLGPLSVDAYVATDRALLARRARNVLPDTLTFLTFDRPGALLGFHQSAAQELRLDRVHELGLPIQRRLTGGGALYVEDGVFGWELFLQRSSLPQPDLAANARALCEMAAAGLSSLGVDAKFRPRNDIEVEGRKICGTGGVQEEDAFLYQGSVLLDFDAARMVDVLRIPVEKMRDKVVQDARARVTSLRALLGTRPAEGRVADVLTAAFSRGLGVEFVPSTLTADDRHEIDGALREVRDPEWLTQNDRPVTETPVRQGIHRCPGGLLRVALLVDERRQRVKQVWITGDFFVEPGRLVFDLEAALRDIGMEQVRERIEAFFAGYPADLFGLSPADFADAIESVLHGNARWACA